MNNKIEIFNNDNEVSIKSVDLVEIINEMRKVESELTDKRYIELQHKDFIKKIRTEVQTLKNLGLEGERNFSPISYMDKSNRKKPCYSLTRDGMLQMLNSESVYVRAKTIEHINKLESKIKTLEVKKVDKLTEMETETKLNNSQTRKANSLMRMHKECNDPIVKELLFKKAIETLTGKKLIDNTRKTYSAEEIGKKFGISANRVGRIANANNLKTEQYGEMVAIEYNDKAQGSTFRYYDTVIPAIEKLLKEQKE